MNVPPLDYETPGGGGRRPRANVPGAWSCGWSVLLAGVVAAVLLSGNGYLAVYSFLVTVPTSMAAVVLAVRARRGSPDQRRFAFLSMWILVMAWAWFWTEIVERVTRKHP